jgi:hypothetical protein
VSGGRKSGQCRRHDPHPRERSTPPTLGYRLGENGDRWTITHVARSGGLTVRHSRSQLTVRLPADYVQASTGLGYATTIYATQGGSADTMHGLLTGQESRQQLYTMLTRGRHANHLYLQVIGDGDPHTLIRPETVVPPTPTETLQQILGRDEAPVSASTMLRQLNDPAARLFQAVERYTDGIHLAAEQLVGSRILAELDRVDKYIPGLVADLACQIRDLATRARDQPVWARPGSHPSTALIGEIAVWRAARGIDPQDPRPTGGHQPEAAADLWKQHLDRDVARAIEPHNSNVDQRQPPRKALNHGYDDIQRPYQTPRPKAPSSPGR